MDDTTDGITFERVTRTDLDDIVGLAQAAWYSPDGLGDLAAGTLDEAGLDGDEREVAARLLATDEVASVSRGVTWGMKALLDGRSSASSSRRDSWRAPRRPRTGRVWGSRPRGRRAAACRPRARGTRDGASEPVYLDEAPGNQTEMRAEAGLANQPRVLLLVVGEAARGHGLGRRLLARARDHFSRHGAERYWLVTDTDCDWPFYEHLGLERLAERTGAVADAPERYFVYGGRA